MTVLSNHRLHSYKCSAASHNRDISPKKIPEATMRRNSLVKGKKVAVTNNLSNSSKKEENATITLEVTTPVPTIMERTIYVWGEQYTVQIPPNYDIYEGLRRWYPSLYEAVIQEEKLFRQEELMEEELLKQEVYEDDDELVWAHQDYLEWLCD